MSYRISIEFPSQRDFHLVRLLLDRLGVPYHREEIQEEASSHWLGELGLAHEPTPMSYEAHLASSWQPPVQTDSQAIGKLPYGAWEREEESLEDLLGMLTS